MFPYELCSVCRKGIDLYFKRHDGQAVTCDDFFAAMADANGEDLSALRNWYSQAGTPKLEVTCEHNASAKTFTLHTKQSTPATPGQTSKAPVLIPLTVGLLGPDGQDLPLHLQVCQHCWAPCLPFPPLPCSEKGVGQHWFCLIRPFICRSAGTAAHLVSPPPSALFMRRAWLHGGLLLVLQVCWHACHTSHKSCCPLLMRVV